MHAPAAKLPHDRLSRLERAIEKATGASGKRVEKAAKKLLRRYRPVTRPPKASVKDGLNDVARNAKATADAVRRLPPVARAALELNEPALQSLTTSLRILHASAEAARKNRNTKSGRRPQRRSSVERMIAFETGTAFCVLTGEGKLTASRPFIALLSDVYETLGIKASARDQAKALVAGNIRLPAL